MPFFSAEAPAANWFTLVQKRGPQLSRCGACTSSFCDAHASGQLEDVAGDDSSDVDAPGPTTALSEIFSMARKLGFPWASEELGARCSRCRNHDGRVLLARVLERAWCHLSTTISGKVLLSPVTDPEVSRLYAASTGATCIGPIIAAIRSLRYNSAQQLLDDVKYASDTLVEAAGSKYPLVFDAAKSAVVVIGRDLKNWHRLVDAIESTITNSRIDRSAYSLRPELLLGRTVPRVFKSRSLDYWEEKVKNAPVPALPGARERLAATTIAALGKTRAPVALSAAHAMRVKDGEFPGTPSGSVEVPSRKEVAKRARMPHTAASVPGAAAALMRGASSDADAVIGMMDLPTGPPDSSNTDAEDVASVRSGRSGRNGRGGKGGRTSRGKRADTDAGSKSRRKSSKSRGGGSDEGAEDSSVVASTAIVGDDDGELAAAAAFCRESLASGIPACAYDVILANRVKAHGRRGGLYKTAYDALPVDNFRSFVDWSDRNTKIVKGPLPVASLRRGDTGSVSAADTGTPGANGSGTPMPPPARGTSKSSDAKSGRRASAKSRKGEPAWDVDAIRAVSALSDLSRDPAQLRKAMSLAEEEERQEALGFDEMAELLPPSTDDITALFSTMSESLRRAVAANGALRKAWSQSRRAMLHDVDGGVVTLGEGRIALEYKKANDSLRARIRELEVENASLRRRAASAATGASLDISESGVTTSSPVNAPTTKRAGAGIAARWAV